MDRGEQKKIQKFIADCNEFIEGRYLIAGKKINEILTDIATCKSLYNYFDDRLQDFDFERVFDRVFENGDGKLASNEIVPFVFCLLSDFDSDRINLNQFLSTYFNDREIDKLRLFSQALIVPFKNIIADSFNIDKNLYLTDLQNLSKTEEQDEPEEQECEEIEEEDTLNTQLDVLFKNCHEIALQIISTIDFIDSEREEYEDAEYVARGIISASELKNIECLNGLVIGLAYISKKLKPLRNSVQELSDLIYDFYENYWEQDEN